MFDYCNSKYSFTLFVILFVQSFDGALLVGWSPWLEWSECSRACDGGASYRKRICTDEDASGSSCLGTNVEYRTCNNQPCGSEELDFRLVQCSRYNNVPQDGRIYEWLPVSISEISADPCSLICQAKVNNNDNNNDDNSNDDSHRNNSSYSLRLAKTALDGTRCSPDEGAFDMCIDGVCQLVGCNHEIGSSVRTDMCGVCGGDNSTCSIPTLSGGRSDDDVFHDLFNGGATTRLFEWHQNQESSECSVSCGVGHEVSVVQCREVSTNKVVKEEFCLDLPKPEPEVRLCRRHSCHPVWIAGDWQECSRSCGEGGVSRRTAYCVQEMADESFQRIPDRLCMETKPMTEKGCNQIECPQWFAGQWSLCSKTCGTGHQLRAIVCRRTEQHNCDEADKPIARQLCHTETPCIGQKESPGDPDEFRRRDGSEGDLGEGFDRPDQPDYDLYGRGWEIAEHGERDLSHLYGNERYYRLPSVILPTILPTQLVQGSPEQGGPEHGITDPGSQEHGITEHGGLEHGITEHGGRDHGITEHGGRENTEHGSGDDGYLDKELRQRGKPVDKNSEISMTPRFITSAWGPCSTTCGTGVRTRTVQCRVMMEFTRTIQDLPDYVCLETKPDSSEYCYQADCVSEAVSDIYEWSFIGFGACSRTCGTGSRQPKFECLRKRGSTIVKPDLCSNLHYPVVRSIPCGEEKCPPRWRTMPKGPCSALCGGGWQARQVDCVIEDAEGDVNVVPNDVCTGARPPNPVLCNMAPCPPNWSIDSWTECSVTCGVGIKTRNVRCEQKISVSNTAVVQEESRCLEQAARPATEEICENEACPRSTEKIPTSVISVEDTLVIQFHPQERISLSVGGNATIIEGTTVFIHCPVHRFNRDLIAWTHNNAVVQRRGRVKLCGGGVLKIRHSRKKDAGVYTCLAGKDVANTSIEFHSLDEALRSAEIRKSYIPPEASQLLDRRSKSHVQHDSRSALKRPLTAKYMMNLVPLEAGFLNYIPQPWSTCSKTCGGAGFQGRDIACEITTEELTMRLNDAVCDRKGLIKPIESRDCGFEKCPEWDEGPWEQCTAAECHDVGFGTQRRSVVCRSTHGYQLESDDCNQSEKPIDKRRCPNVNCTTSWSVGNWTQCSGCEGKGVKTRVLQCVWNHNGKPAASSNCSRLSKPESARSCYNLSPCFEKGCTDSSKFCSMIPVFKMCHFSQYQRECCHSCQNNRIKTHQGQHQQHQQHQQPQHHKRLYRYYVV